MNTSKTTLKKTDVDTKKKPKQISKDGGSVSNTKIIVTGAIAVVVVIALIIGISLENLKPRLVMTVNDEKIYMSDAMYYIYQAELNGSYMDSFYQAYYGSSYWDLTDDSGVANRETAKSEVLETMQQSEILYQEAVAAGYKINDEDKKSAKSDVESIREGLSLEQKNKIGMGKKALTKALEKKYCADRYKQDIIDGFDIDDDAIRDGVSYDEFRQYDIQYYTISTQIYDEEGNATAVDDETLALYKAELEELAKRAESEDFDSLTPNAVKATKEAEVTETPEEETDDSETAEESKDTEETDYNSTFTADGKFVVGDGTFTTDFEKIVKKMDNGAVSQVIETESALYLVKMIDNDDDAAYEEEVANQISTEENSQFETWYDEIYANYTVTLNDDVWSEVELGSVIL